MAILNVAIFSEKTQKSPKRFLSVQDTDTQPVGERPAEHVINAWTSSAVHCGVLCLVLERTGQ